jgi:hypothetical protein
MSGHLVAQHLSRGAIFADKKLDSVQQPRSDTPVTKLRSLADISAEDIRLRLRARNEASRVAGLEPETVNLVPRVAEAISSDFQNYLNMATVILAVEVIGAVQNYSQIQYLCDNFPLTNIGAYGLNITMLDSIFCAPAVESIIPAPADQVKGSLGDFADGMWVQQALVAMADNLTTACDIFNVEKAATVGMNGTYVKEVLCAWGASNSSSQTPAANSTAAISALGKRKVGISLFSWSR